MSDAERGRVAVSRRIAAPAAKIFRVLADPDTHLLLDGSGMLRGAASPAPLQRVGDVFAMRMFYAPYGEYEMNNHVVEFEADRRIAWEPVAGHRHPDEGTVAERSGHRWCFELAPLGRTETLVTEIYDCSRLPEADQAAVDEGRIWLGAMTRTLERLEELCLQRS